MQTKVERLCLSPNHYRSHEKVSPCSNNISHGNEQRSWRYRLKCSSLWYTEFRKCKQHCEYIHKQYRYGRHEYNTWHGRCWRYECNGGCWRYECNGGYGKYGCNGGYGRFGRYRYRHKHKYGRFRGSKCRYGCEYGRCGIWYGRSRGR